MDFLYNPDLWANLFTLDHGISLAEKVLRPIVVYAALVALLRLFGNREASQINPMDLVVILSISNTVQNAIIGQDNSLVGGLVGAVALLGINRAVNVLKFRFRRFEAAVEGPPLVLVKNGRVQDDVCAANRITREDLRVMAHENGLSEVDDIEDCVLDPNGTIMVEGKGILKDDTYRHDVLAQLKAIQARLDALGATPAPVAKAKEEGA